MKDVNDFFEQQKTFLIGYYGHLKEATIKADRMTSKHKGINNKFINKVLVCQVRKVG